MKNRLFIFLKSLDFAKVVCYCVVLPEEIKMNAIYIDGYENKISDVRHGTSYGYVTRERERELIEKANESMQIFKEIEEIFANHINSLQIVS